MGVPASRSKFIKANSVALDDDRGARPLTTRKLETFRSEVGDEGMRKEVNAIHAPRMKVTVVRKENTPLSLWMVVCIPLTCPAWSQRGSDCRSLKIAARSYKYTMRECFHDTSIQ